MSNARAAVRWMGGPLDEEDVLACSQVDIGLRSTEEQKACLCEALRNKLSYHLSEAEVEGSTEEITSRRDVHTPELLVETSNAAAAKTCIIEQTLKKRLACLGNANRRRYDPSCR